MECVYLLRTVCHLKNLRYENDLTSDSTIVDLGCPSARKIGERVRDLVGKLVGMQFRMRIQEE